MATESERIRDRMNNPFQGQSAPIIIDGQTETEFDKSVRAQAMDTKDGQLTLLLAEKHRRTANAEKLAELKSERERRDSVVDPRITQDALPTGIHRIDNAGQTVRAGGPLGITPRTSPSLSEHPDHPDRIRKDRADQGVDYNHGLPIWQRMQMAVMPNIPEIRKQKLASILQSEFAKVPDDLPKFRYDPALDEFHFLRPDEDNEGKFRWTSMDGSGLELADLGDMLNLGEIGSMIGAVYGIGKGKVFTFGKGGTGLQAAAGGLGGGTLGRFGGEGVSLLINHMQNGPEPTVDQLMSLGWSGAKIEAFASVTGELGAKLLRGLRNKQKTGNFFVDVPSASDKVAIREAADDLEQLQNVTGRTDIAITRGQATGSIDLLSREAEAIKSTSAGSRQKFLAQQAKNDAATAEYINIRFAGNKQFLGDAEGTVRAANDAIGTAGQVTVAQTDNGLVHFSPAVDPQNGLKLDPLAADGTWQVQSVLLDESKRGAGIGPGLYVAAREEAERHGKVLSSSSTNMNPDSIKIWENFDGKEGWGKLIWNQNVEEIAKGTGRLRSTDGLPIVRMAESEPLVPMLLAARETVERGPSGQIQKGAEWARFLRKPGRKELGAVVEEITANPFLKQDLKQAILEDFSAATRIPRQGAPDGFSVKAFDEWKEETGRVLESVFTPQELLAIRNRPGGLREAVTASGVATNNARNSLSRALQIDAGHPLFKDPSVKGIWAQMKGKEPNVRRRVMRVLDVTGQGDAMRALFKDELRLDLINRTKGTNASGFQKWLKANQKVIEDVLGSANSAQGREIAASGAQSYVKDLRLIDNILKRRSQASMVRGAAREANPTGLALLRVAFGPLSRAQRFITGARRGTNRMTANMSAELIASPEALRALASLRNFDIGSRQAARIIQDIGLDEMLGFVEYDADDEESRKQFSAHVMLMLQDEFDENVE